MKHLELHILQSVPVSCLNRDDLNSPKTAIFGGVQRARVSSQSWKRAIRETAKELSPELYSGKRTKYFYDQLLERMNDQGIINPEEVAQNIVDELVKIDSKSKDRVKAKTMYYMSPLELENIAKRYSADYKTENPSSQSSGEVHKKAHLKALKSALKIKADSLKDAADISLFGRMVANDPSLNIEAASMFSHALSTHRVDNEIDFFTAVDDLQNDNDEFEEESGAGMMGSLEFNSATYYRFAALNLDMLADDDHLGALSKEERQRVVKTFIEATLKAVPTARKNSMNGNTLPAYVLCIVRSKGHPIQLINAFESPVRASGGYIEKSIDLLKAEYDKIHAAWGLEDPLFRAEIPESSISSFLDGVVDHVL